MRIFDGYSPIVSMILRVFSDLKYLAFFFFLMVTMEGLMLSVIVTYSDPLYESVG